MEGAGSIPPVSQVYLFLGKCFSYPQDELYALLKDERIGEEFRALVEELPFTVNFKGIPSPRLPPQLRSLYEARPSPHPQESGFPPRKAEGMEGRFWPGGEKLLRDVP